MAVVVGNVELEMLHDVNVVERRMLRELTTLVGLSSTVQIEPLPSGPAKGQLGQSRSTIRCRSSSPLGGIWASGEPLSGIRKAEVCQARALAANSEVNNML
jgi:hypothetical protein